MFAAALLSCGGKGGEHHDAEHDEHEEGVIHLTEEQCKVAELQTEDVAATEFEECIRVSGQVAVALGDDVVLTAKSSGIVSYVHEHLSEGIAVKGGETLASITATAMAGGDEVARLASDLDASRKAYERAKRLLADSIISQKEYERISNEYGKARLAAAGQGSAGSVVKSPVAGFISSIAVRPGEYVEAGAPIATVTKNCNLQLRAELPEKYFNLTGKIRSARFRMSYESEIHLLDTLGGRLVSVGRMLKGDSPFIPVTFEFTNDGCMVPGAFADIWLLTDRRSNVISVPSGAVTEEQGLHYVYLLLDADEPGVREFEKREVTVGMGNGLRTEILRGLKGGEKIVVNGVTQVKLAGASGAIPEAHSHSH